MNDIKQLNVRMAHDQKSAVDEAAKLLRVSIQAFMRAGAMELVERVNNTQDAYNRDQLATWILKTGRKV